MLYVIDLPNPARYPCHLWDVFRRLWGTNGLHHPIDLSPLIDVLLTHYVWVDEKISVTDTEVFLAGCTLEAFQVVHFVLYSHSHLVGPDSLVTGGTEAILAKKPEIVSSTEFSAQFIIQSSSHFSKPTATQVTTEAVFMPVLINCFEEITVPDILLAPSAC